MSRICCIWAEKCRIVEGPCAKDLGTWWASVGCVCRYSLTVNTSQLMDVQGPFVICDSNSGWVEKYMTGLWALLPRCWREWIWILGRIWWKMCVCACAQLNVTFEAVVGQLCELLVLISVTVFQKHLISYLCNLHRNCSVIYEALLFYTLHPQKCKKRAWEDRIGTPCYHSFV